MKSGWHQEIRREQGFEVFELGKAAVSLAVIPELGAKVSSLKKSPHWARVALAAAR
jgi:hypothetical protein